MSSPLSSSAQQAKNIGDQYYKNHCHEKAVEQYTIALADTSSRDAILHGNRAAAYIALEKFSEALKDSELSIQLDPMYAKGFGRIGTCYERLGRTKHAADAYATAMQILDEANDPSISNRSLYREYRSNFVAIESKEREILSQRNSYETDPWIRAKQLGEVPQESSAALIISARKDIEDGFTAIKSWRMSPDGRISGRLGGIVSLTNGILKDGRAFEISGSDFIESLDRHMHLEMVMAKAWPLNLTSEDLLQEARKSVDISGWDLLKNALDITVRCWFLMAFLGQGYLYPLPHYQILSIYEKIVSFVEAGRVEWVAIPGDIRGEVFDDWFLMAVKKHHLIAYVRAVQDSYLPPSHPLSLSVPPINVRAKKIVDHLDGITLVHATDPIKRSAFFRYPKATAYAVQGFCSECSPLSDPTNRPLVEWVCQQTAIAYENAAYLYHEDDEKRFLYLELAIFQYGVVGLPVCKALALLEDAMKSYVKMEKIWGKSDTSIGGVRGSSYRLGLMEKDIRRLLTAGAYDLQSVIQLPYGSDEPQIWM